MLCVDFGYFTRILSPIWSLSFLRLLSRRSSSTVVPLRFAILYRLSPRRTVWVLAAAFVAFLFFCFFDAAGFALSFFAVAAADSCFAFELRNVSATFVVVVVSACYDAFSGVTVPLMLSVGAIFPTIAVVSVAAVVSLFSAPLSHAGISGFFTSRLSPSGGVVS